jgi:uncharacterized cupredoxin-like copper-binding protein
MLRSALIPGLLLMTGALIACGGGGDGESTSSSSDAPAKASGPKIVASLKEFTIELDKATAAPGSISFEAQNKGTTPHELKIVKTDLAPDKLPVKEGKVDESAVQVLAKTSEFAAGKSETITANLTAGKYVLICNVVAHYPAGMHLAFAVE